jgi:hypothetical protein
MLAIDVRPTCADTVSLDASDSGSYDATGFHDPDNSNFLTGAINLSGNIINRSFLIFDLASVDKQIVGAELQVQVPNNVGYSSPDETETFTTYHVSTAPSTVTTGGSGLTAIFDDLGDGTVYGSLGIAKSDENFVVSIALNDDFLSDANDGSGLIVIGGALTSIDDDSSAYVFGGTNSANADLVLTFVPEPGSLFICCIGITALALWRDVRPGRVARRPSD